MEHYKSSVELIKSFDSLELSEEVIKSFVRAFAKIHGYNDITSYPKIMVSVSGGSDSDIMLDMIERIGHPLSEIHYVFFDTGIEYDATMKHLSHLEEKYGIKIERIRAKTPVGVGVRKYGVPFLSKTISQYISRLQKHGFKWEDKPFEELWAKYPRCKAALRWWCNAWGEDSQINISKHRYLKEFMIENPPDFMISDECCKGAKKDTAKILLKELNPDLSCQGIRKSEGGARGIRYNTCFDKHYGKCDVFRPIFWLKNDDKKLYEKAFYVEHSECYTKYGLTRTGCACCPFGKNFEKELKAAEVYEPRLFKTANTFFGKSYDYTRKYYEYRKRRKENEKNG